jgi:hypothetical protein
VELDDLQDYLEPEVAIVAALVAALLTPQARSLVRRGAVYGMSGLLAASDAIGGLVRGVQQSVQPTAPSFMQDLADEARAERRRAQENAASSSTSDTPLHIESPQPQP